MRLRNWPLAIKIILLFFLTSLGMGAVLYTQFLPRLQQAFLDQRRQAIASTVDVAVAGILPYVRMDRTGQSEEERRWAASSFLRGLRYGISGYFFVLSRDGRVLVHPDASLVGKDMRGQKDAAGRPFWDEMLAGAAKDGAGSVTYLWPKPGQSTPLLKVTAYRAVPEWGWIVASGIWVDDVESDLLSLGRVLFLEALPVVGGILLLLITFSFFMTRPAREFLRQSQKILEGDLTVDVDTDRRDEIGSLVHGIGSVLNRLVGIIDRIVPVAVRIDDSIVVLRGAVERTVNGTEQQADRARQISAAAEEMSHTVADVARTASSASSLSNEAMQVALGGRQFAERASKGVATVNEAARTLADRFARMDASAHRIGEVVSLIRSIAEQTNLIALNASIEASRAGVAGSRFAVIAEEVRKLARNAGDATDDVTGAVQSVQQDVIAIREAMHAVSEHLGATSGAIGEADESLNNIVRKFQSVDTNISQIAASIEELSITSRDVSRNITESNEISAEIDKMARMVKQEFNHLVEVADQLRGATVGVKTKATEKIILDLAKTDHRIFVEKIGACLRGENDMQAAGIADHTQCRFGKWYFSEGMKKCGHVQVFKDIDGPHAAVHRLGRQAVEQYRSNQPDLAAESLLKMEDQSQEIVSLLEQLKVVYEREC